MAAYLISDGEVTDAALFAEFAEGILPVMDAHGGKYLVRGGATQVVGGDFTPHRLVVIEFESMERLQALIASPEYIEMAEIRDKSSNSNTIIVDGV